MPDDPRQIASANDLARRYGADAIVFARILSEHPDDGVRKYWRAVMDLLGASARPSFSIE